MKNLLKKFRDFRLTAKIEGCLGLVSAICSLALLLFYQFNQVDPEDPSKIVTGFNGEPILGMMMFLFGLFALIFSIVVVYTSYPFIFKKEEKLDDIMNKPTQAIDNDDTEDDDDDEEDLFS